MKSDSSAVGTFLSGGTGKIIYWAIFSWLGFTCVLSFWLFSRFTVDDAFITWRYGKNLIESGVWGYNPVSFDLTQAYTNPLYAVLSILPHYFGVDVVLFFKMVSVFILLVFGFWYSNRTNKGLFVVFVYAVPATFIHAFSGLETLLYVCLLTMFFIFLIEDEFYKVVACTIALFMTRPESWALLAIVPFYYILPRSLDGFGGRKDFKSIVGKVFCLRAYNIKKFMLVIFLLSFPMALYFSFHKIYFGYALPNTFYAKSGRGIDFLDFLYFGFLVFPVSALLLINKIRVFLVALLFFGAVIFSYSTSNLLMNYIDRFAFHLIFPSCFVLMYVVANFLHGGFRFGGSGAFKKSREISYKRIGSFVAVFWILIFSAKNFSISSLIDVVNYYPRAMDAHAELGKVIKTNAAVEDIDSMSFGDAGMVAYHAEITSLDNIGLGSSMVVHEGVNLRTLDAYNPDVIVFHAVPTSIIFTSNGQDKIYSWAESSGHFPICQVYFRLNYTLNVYSRFNLIGMQNICDYSKDVNGVEDGEYFFEHALVPPWKYWKV